MWFGSVNDTESSVFGFYPLWLTTDHYFIFDQLYYHWKISSECLCNINGSLDTDNSSCTTDDPCQCDTNGICSCDIGYMADKCNECIVGYYDTDDSDDDSMANCTECLCNINGSLNADNSACTTDNPCQCDTEGICSCGTGYMADKCNECIVGYYDTDDSDDDPMANCTECLCNTNGSLKADNSTCTSDNPCPCDTDGICSCGAGYMADKCNECIVGYYDTDDSDNDSMANCTECLCDIDGSLKADNTICTSNEPCPCNSNGVCSCKDGYYGDKCDQGVVFFNFLIVWVVLCV